MMKKTIIIATVAVVVIAGGLYRERQSTLGAIDSFEKCAKLYPVMETFPEQCRTPDGRLFVRELLERPDVALGDEFTLTIGSMMGVAEKMTVRLLTIDDSRCKAGVQCVWEGELSPLLVVQKAGSPDQELRFGTSRTSEVIFENTYRFVLVRATETSATFIVTPLNTQAQ